MAFDLALNHSKFLVIRRFHSNFSTVIIKHLLEYMVLYSRDSLLSDSSAHCQKSFSLSHSSFYSLYPCTLASHFQRPEASFLR